MRTFEYRRHPARDTARKIRFLSIWGALVGCSMHLLGAQATAKQTMSQQIQMLTDAMARTQAQVQESQRELDEMRKQLVSLQRQMEGNGSEPVASAPSPTSERTDPAPSPAAQSESTRTTAAIQELRERQALQESQIATLDQSKVESVSKYPVKLTGLVLMNGFVNTRAVDMPATPTIALQGHGTTGATVQQTVLGLDARGPHLFGARSFADVRVDFAGIPESSSTATTYSGFYSANATLLRLRTVHAALQWEHTKAYFSLDRPITSPNYPTSLTAVAEPALAWSGNLWAWNPQVGVTHDIQSDSARDLRLQAALIEVADAPVTPILSPAGVIPPSTAELSRWPGVEARVALLTSRGTTEEENNQFGIGGFFAPHRIAEQGFDSWAVTLDTNYVMPAGLQFTGSFYRGAALGGMGGGAYKDIAFYNDVDTGEFYFRPLDDVGGWAQLKEKFSQRVQINAAFGIDNAFASELRRYYVPGGSVYQNLARNRTYTGNVIYSPSAYLLFSLEYRHLESSPVIGAAAGSNIIGLGAGYKF